MGAGSTGCGILDVFELLLAVIGVVMLAVAVAAILLVHLVGWLWWCSCLIHCSLMQYIPFVSGNAILFSFYISVFSFYCAAKLYIIP